MLQTNFGFERTKDEDMKTGVIAIPVINPLQNYALVEDEPNSCSLTNTATPLDLGEKLTYGCREIPEVACGLRNQHPTKTKGGVQYQVKLETLLSVTDSNDSTYREDLPIVAYLTIRHPRSGAIKTSDVNEVVARMLSAAWKGTTDANGNNHNQSRFGDLMRSALRPTVGGVN